MRFRAQGSGNVECGVEGQDFGASIKDKGLGQGRYHRSSALGLEETATIPSNPKSHEPLKKP